MHSGDLWLTGEHTDGDGGNNIRMGGFFFRSTVTAHVVENRISKRHALMGKFTSYKHTYNAPFFGKVRSGAGIEEAILWKKSDYRNIWHVIK